MRIAFSAVAALVCSVAFSSPFDAVRLVGRTNKDPVSYKVGEKVEFTLALKGMASLPDGAWSVGWTLTGDDGWTSQGKSPISLAKPVKVAASLTKPGFVRLEAYLLDAAGKKVMRDVPAPGENWHNVKEVFFDGGAGADVAKIRQADPEPEDFDAYWAKQRAELAKVPVKAQRTEVKSPNPKVRLYAVRVDCAGGRPVTGYMSVPVECESGKKVHARVTFDGYGTPIQRPPESIWNVWAIDFHINAHGYELGQDDAYYQKFFEGIKSNGRDYAYDPVQNANPDTAYFHGMALRVIRALEYIESMPEWNGTKIDVEGGSQGGLQTVWAAAMNEHVTDANPGFVWCCDIGKKGLGRQKSVAEPEPTPALRYYDAVNHAKRIKAKVFVPRAGLGDYLCPPSGLAAFFNSLKTKDKKIKWVQGSRHGYVPPEEEPDDAEEAEDDDPNRPSTARDLITNCSLEKIQDDGSAAELGGHPGRLMIDATGNHYIRIVQEKPGTMTSIYRKHDIAGGYDRLAVSLKARITGLVKGDENWYDARIIFNVSDASGKVVKSDAVVFDHDTPDWVSKRQVIELPADAKTLEYMITMFNCKGGAFDFDDIRMTLLKPGDRVPGAPRAQAVRKYKDPKRPALAAKDALRVQGNRLVNAAGQEVWLQGLAIPSMEWQARGDHVKESFEAAVSDWNVNVIRLPLYSGFWFGRGKEGKDTHKDGGEGYRAQVDALVDFANARGVYVVLDLHEYRAAQQHHAEFWRDAAKRYANRPGVLFDILNEPYNISWREWRDGGELKDGGGLAAVETLDGSGLRNSIGMQKLVDELRATGAKNVIIAGGLDWSYDCTGILNGFALKDPSGNGIAYSVHVYPWKTGWQKNFLDCAEKYPLFLGEVGCMEKKMDFERTLRDPYIWAPEMLACIQKHRLNWTAWSFHPQAEPCVIVDWDYTPTTCWGSFVRAALRGAKFTSENIR